MRVGSSSVITGTSSQAIDQLYFEVKAGNLNAQLIELHLTQTAGNLHAGRLGRSFGSIPSTIQQCFPEDPAANTLVAFIATTWSVLPAVNKIGLRRMVLSGTTGVAWIFPRGLFLPANTGLGYWAESTTTSSGTSITAVIEE